MDYLLTEEQIMIRDLARQIAVEKIVPVRAELDEQNKFPGDIMKAMAQADLFGIYIPEEYGGRGRSMTDLAILLEVAGYHYGDLGSWIFRNVSHGGVAILLHGTEEQKREILPRTASGQAHFAFGLTEPDAGSDAAAVSRVCTMKPSTMARWYGGMSVGAITS